MAQPDDKLDALRVKVALACRILARAGLVEGILGHVSVRLADGETMLIRCRSEQECGVLYTAPDAVRKVDFDGRGADLLNRYEVPKELPIHGEIYRARPEVGCVVHAHPPAALICGLAELPLRPIFGAFNIPAMRMALEGVPIFPRSVLITRPELAAALIAAMGDRHVCLMRGHGVTVTGATIEEATIRAINFNILAQVTQDVAQTGRSAQPIAAEDIAELPDLGSRFNDQWVWRYYERLDRQAAAQL